MNLLCRRRAIIAYGTATFTGEYVREAATKKKPSPSSLCNKPNDTVFITTLCGMRLWGSSTKQFMLFIPFKIVALYQMSSYFCSLKLCSCINNQPKKLIVWNGSRPRNIYLGLPRWNIFDKTLDLIGPPHSVKTRPNSLKKADDCFYSQAAPKLFLSCAKTFPLPSQNDGTRP